MSSPGKPRVFGVNVADLPPPPPSPHSPTGSPLCKSTTEVKKKAPVKRMAPPTSPPPAPPPSVTDNMTEVVRQAHGKFDPSRKAAPYRSNELENSAPAPVIRPRSNSNSGKNSRETSPTGNMRARKTFSEVPPPTPTTPPPGSSALPLPGVPAPPVPTLPPPTTSSFNEYSPRAEFIGTPPTAPLEPHHHDYTGQIKAQAALLVASLLPDGLRKKKDKDKDKDKDGPHSPKGKSVRDSRVAIKIVFKTESDFGSSEVLKRVELTTKVGELVSGLLRKKRLPPSDDYGLFLPSMGIWLDNSAPLYYYHIDTTNEEKLEFRKKPAKQDAYEGQLLLKVYSPDHERMKTVQFNKEIKTEDMIPTILEKMEQTKLPPECYHLFIQNEDGTTLMRISEGRKLSSYGLQQMDMIEIRKRPCFHFVIGDTSVVLDEKVTVSEAVKLISKVITTPFPRTENLCLVVHHHKGINQDLWLMDEKPLCSYELNVGDVLELRERDRKISAAKPVRLELNWCPPRQEEDSKGPVNLFLGRLQLLGGEVVVLKMVDVCRMSILEPQPVSGDLFITNYRITFFAYGKTEVEEVDEIPVGSIYKLDKNVNTCTLEVSTKDFRQLIFVFPTKNQSVQKVHETVAMVAFPGEMRSLFAFVHGAVEKSELDLGWNLYDPLKEFKRMGVPNSRWRISQVNVGFGWCESYPDLLIVPESFSDEKLKEVAHYRSKGRIPALSYLHTNSASITRASQPHVGISDQRCKADEELLSAIRATNYQNSQTLYLLDARPAAAAYGNKVKGAGYENMEWYPNCHFDFLNIPNIHAVRGALQQVIEACNDYSPGNESSWLSSVESSKWLEQIRFILRGAERISRIIIEKQASVFVHCSDGWDRTSQLCALSQIMMDPYFRTFTGFIVLVEKDWCEFGHQFNTRLGHGEKTVGDQRAPIFLQFLDCVWQLMNLLPSAFEFNEDFLLEIWLQLTSCRYGTFLVDKSKERNELKIREKTISVWQHLLRQKSRFVNHFYQESKTHIIPFISGKSVELWKSCYFYWHDWFRSRRKVANSKINDLFAELAALRKQVQPPADRPPAPSPK